MKNISKCLLCSERLDKSNKFSVDKKYEYLTCSRCSVGNLSPQPSEKELNKLYSSKKYYEYLSKDVSSDLRRKIFSLKTFKDPSEWIIDALNSGKVLDVGCGNGEFLEALKKNGWKAYGSDYSDLAKETTEKKIGIRRVKKGVFSRQRFSDKYDLVSFWHVLEHLEDPGSYLRKAHSILRKGGLVAGEVPNFDSLWLRIFKKNYSWVMVPEHRVYFSANSMEYLLKESGFHNIKVFSVRRSLLNMSYSVRNWSMSRFKKEIIATVLFVLSIPFSVIITSALSVVKKGEVLRFIARK